MLPGFWAVSEPNSSQLDQVVLTLCAAVLSPGLRSLLVFDATSEKLREVTQAANEILRATSNRPVVNVTLQSRETDDDLFGSFTPHSANKESLCWQLGLIGDDGNPRVVLIPDLTQLSLIAARAGIMLLGEAIAYLERHGQHRIWQPEIFWIAGCATRDVGKVSAHLLDRFAIRIRPNKTVPNEKRRVLEIRRFINEEKTEDTHSVIVPPDIGEVLNEARRFRPQLTDEAITRLWEYLPKFGFSGTRRDLALARLALVHAQLEHQSSILEGHVDSAARLIGLNRSTNETTPTPSREEEEEKMSEADASTSTRENETISRPVEQPVKIDRKPTQQLAEQVETPPEPFPSAPLPSEPATPYPEDQAPVDHEDAPLRLPPHTTQRSATENGPIIGTQRATALYDLAFVRTLLEAAKFQPIRRKHVAWSAPGLLISASDLHSYRREPIAEQMLVLVLDYTSLGDSDWEGALFPYLKEAYTERAMICFVKVGAADSRQELRAERIEARSILVPSIGHAFNSQAGRATPLAHGLDLAYQTLRRYLQHGRGGPYRATLVVLSDGRGNVPLDASRRGEITSAVMRKGIDDALLIARQIRNLDYVRVILLNPLSQQYPELPLELATSLGADVRNIRIHDHSVKQ